MLSRYIKAKALSLLFMIVLSVYPHDTLKQAGPLWPSYIQWNQAQK